MNFLICYTKTEFRKLSQRKKSSNFKDYQINAGKLDIENCKNCKIKDGEYADFSCNCASTNAKNQDD